MRRSSVVVCLVLALVGWVAPVGAAAPAGTATGSSTLPFEYQSGLVSDPVRDVAYIAGGGDDGQVVVVDRSGSIVRHITGLPFPTNIALSPDRSTLYVGEARADAIVAVDLTTDVRVSYPIGDTGVYDLAVVGQKVWFSAVEELTSEPPLGVLDTTTGAVTTGLGPDVAHRQRVVADPTDPNTLFVAGDEIYRLDITPTATGAPQTRSVAQHDFGSGGPPDVRVTPDGSQVITTAGVLRASDLALVDTYPAADDPYAVAVRADGTVAVGGRTDFGYDLYVYGPDQTTFAERTDYDAGKQDYEYVEYHGVEFGSTTLFTVTTQLSGPGTRTLTVYASEPAPPGDPIGSSTLDTANVTGAVNDPTRHQTFLATGYTGNGIIVVDDQGRVTRVLHHLPNVQQMTLSGGTLWASVAGTGDVVAVDTRTYAERRYPVPDFNPLGIAVTDGLVWFTAYSRKAGYDSMLGALDPGTGTISRVLDGPQVYLKSSPAFPHRLYAYGGGVGSRIPSATRYAARGGAHPSLRVVAQGHFGEDVQDLEFTRNHENLVYAAPYGPTRSSSAVATTLKPIGVSHGQYNAASVAVRADGLVATGFSFIDEYENYPWDVFVRWGAAGAKVATLTSGEVVPRGIAFAGRDLIAVTRVGLPGNCRFEVHVLRMPALRH